MASKINTPRISYFVLAVFFIFKVAKILANIAIYAIFYFFGKKMPAFKAFPLEEKPKFKSNKKSLPKDEEPSALD